MSVEIYTSSVGASNFIKQTLLDIKGQIIVGSFSTLFSSTDIVQTPPQRMSTESEQIDLTNIYRIAHSKAIEYIFYLAASKSFCKKNHSGPQPKS